MNPPTTKHARIDVHNPALGELAALLGDRLTTVPAVLANGSVIRTGTRARLHSGAPAPASTAPATAKSGSPKPNMARRSQ
jgi:hypothetical protein